jgi:hypothetical protein
MGPGYQVGQQFAGHHLHYYPGGGPASLLGLMVFPFGLLLFAGLCAAAHRVENRLRRPRPSSGAAPRTLAVRPTLASDVERDAIAQRVSHAIGEGRLSIDEGYERIDAVLRARHRHELTRLVADLPQLAPAPAGRRTGVRSVLLVSASAVVVAALVVQLIVGLWALWPAAVVMLGAAALLPRR